MLIVCDCEVNETVHDYMRLVLTDLLYKVYIYILLFLNMLTCESEHDEHENIHRKQKSSLQNVRFNQHN